MSTCGLLGHPDYTYSYVHVFYILWQINGWLVMVAHHVTKKLGCWLKIKFRPLSVEVPIVWFQKISISPPRRELEIPEGWGVKGPGNSGEEGVVSEIMFPNGQVRCCDDLVVTA